MSWTWVPAIRSGHGPRPSTHGLSAAFPDARSVPRHERDHTSVSHHLSAPPSPLRPRLPRHISRTPPSTRCLHHGFTKGHAPGRLEYVGAPPVLATPIHLARRAEQRHVLTCRCSRALCRTGQGQVGRRHGGYVERAPSASDLDAHTGPRHSGQHAAHGCCKCRFCTPTFHRRLMCDLDLYPKQVWFLCPMLQATYD
jgi:hypothetical protein